MWTEIPLERALWPLHWFCCDASKGTAMNKRGGCVTGGADTTVSATDVDLVVEAIRGIGTGRAIADAAEYGYRNLPLCLIDAVFSLREPYKQVRCTVKSFARHWDTTLAPPVSDSPALTLSVFLRGVEGMSAERLAEEVFHDAHKAPGCRGLLKSAVVVDLGVRLREAGIQTREDILKDENDANVRIAVEQTKGIGSVGLRYLRMLCGDEDEAKPDVWIYRFLEEDVLHRGVSESEAVALLRAATERLRDQTPELTLRGIDHVIWLHKSGSQESDY